MRRAKDPRIRVVTEKAFGFAEELLYVLIAGSLALAGFLYFGYVVYDFVAKASGDQVSTQILALLDGLLLVFIITEIIHTIRAVIVEKELVSEPFLVVGIVAAIRRLVVVSAEAKELFGTPDFGDAMLEIGMLTAAVFFLGATIFMLRHTEHSEPRPAHEPTT
ncbi:MAG: phosphate-starvation-inducible PsiE family protein [Actinomycetota bacterium]